MNNNLEIKLKELKMGYLKKLESMVLSFKALLSDKDINIEELYQKVHTISGTAGMYGLSKLSGDSTEFEIYLKEIRGNSNSAEKNEVEARLLKYIEALEDTVGKGE